MLTISNLKQCTLKKRAEENNIETGLCAKDVAKKKGVKGETREQMHVTQLRQVNT